MFASSASAHEPPFATDVAFDANDDVYVRTNRGLIRGRLDDSSWQLVCQAAYRVTTTDIPEWVVKGDGGVLVSTPVGLLRGTDGLCTWAPAHPELDDVLMAGMFEAPSLPGLLYAIRTTDGQHTDFYVSDDEGDTWQARGAQQIDVFFQDVVVAPSDSERLYSTGVRLDSTGSNTFLAASSDGARTWLEHPMSLEPTEVGATVLAVDAANPDRVYARTRATNELEPERLVISEDAGATFRTLLSGLELGGLALGPDGQTLWVGAADGVWRSNDEGQSFVSANTSVTDVTCLVERGTELWACGRFGLSSGVGVSDDGGDTFQQVLAYSDVTERVSCPGTETEASCETWWTDWERDTFGTASDGGVADGGVVVLPPSAFDGGRGPTPDPPPASENGGCGCRTTSAGGSGPEVAWLAVALALGFARRRR